MGDLCAPIFQGATHIMPFDEDTIAYSKTKSTGPVAKGGHDEVEELGRTWLAMGRLSEGEKSFLLVNLRELQLIYERHIAVEDNEVFPLAKEVLDSKTLSDVGREMAERRGQNYDWQARRPHR